MSHTNINITEANEQKLTLIRTVANINKVDVAGKEKLVNYAIHIAAELIWSLDEDTLISVVNLKKSI